MKIENQSPQLQQQQLIQEHISPHAIPSGFGNRPTLHTAHTWPLVAADSGDLTKTGPMATSFQDENFVLVGHVYQVQTL